MVDGEAVSALSGAIAEIRHSLKLEPEEPFKFTSNAGPSSQTTKDRASVKNEVLEHVAKANAVFLVQVVHESIAAGCPDNKEHWALDNIASQFETLLTTQGDVGLVIQYHNEKVKRTDVADITSGVTVRGPWAAAHDRILGVADSHVEAMPPLSAIDIVLEAFRYCLEYPPEEVELNIFGHITSLLPSTGPSLDSWIDSHIFFSPRIETVKVTDYRKDCESIVDDLKTLYSLSNAL